jgi:hypothetical protein
MQKSRKLRVYGKIKFCPNSKMDLVNALIAAHNYSVKTAENEIKEMRNRVLEDLEDPEEILNEYGLEPDYIFDLLF